MMDSSIFAVSLGTLTAGDRDTVEPIARRDRDCLDHGRESIRQRQAVPMNKTRSARSTWGRAESCAHDASSSARIVIFRLKAEAT